MANIQKIGKGIMIFFIGTLGSILSYAITNPILEAVTDPTDPYALSTTSQGIIWLGLIIVWVLVMIILPAHFIIEGLKEQTGE